MLYSSNSELKLVNIFHYSFRFAYVSKNLVIFCFIYFDDILLLFIQFQKIYILLVNFCLILPPERLFYFALICTQVYVYLANLTNWKTWPMEVASQTDAAHGC